MKEDIILEVKDLKTYFYTNKKCNRAVDGVSFDLIKGKTLCLVGESGCGKSATAASIMQLIPDLARIEEGEILLNTKRGIIKIHDLKKNGKEMRNIRGSVISMIFQDPMVALNPVFTIGYQIKESLKYHENLSRRAEEKVVIELLRQMGIPAPEKRVREYPYQFSGGMRQRAMIAMAMACNPEILIADEPTTALDVTIQAQIFELMTKLKEDKGTSILLITHDMGVVNELADDVAVMYMGNIVEMGTADEVLRDPRHPYTQALLRSIPVLGKGRNQHINPIKGVTPDPFMRPVGCQFRARCDFDFEKCCVMPKSRYVSKTHCIRCWCELGGENNA